MGSKYESYDITGFIQYISGYKIASDIMFNKYVGIEKMLN